MKSDAVPYSFKGDYVLREKTGRQEGIILYSPATKRLIGLVRDQDHLGLPNTGKIVLGVRNLPGDSLYLLKVASPESKKSPVLWHLRAPDGTTGSDLGVYEGHFAFASNLPRREDGEQRARSFLQGGALRERLLEFLEAVDIEEFREIYFPETIRAQMRDIAGQRGQTGRFHFTKSPSFPDSYEQFLMGS